MASQSPAESQILDKLLEQKEIEDLSSVDPSSVVADLLSKLSPREADILKRRHGLSGNEPETLESIGSLYKITRERIRQIARGAELKLQKSPKYAKTVSIIEGYTRHILEMKGGLSTEDDLFAEILSSNSSHNSHARRSLRFVLRSLSSKFVYLPESEFMRSSWIIKYSTHELFENVINEALSVFDELGVPVHWSVFWSKFQERPIMLKHRQVLTDIVVQSYLHVSTQIAQNPFGEWGKTEWARVNPRRISDKIYLVLNNAHKPMHFSEIANAIEGLKFDAKRANAATVHNELIIDPRYVLVGRGMYGLAEWGLRSGVVSDVVRRILRDAHEPLAREEIIRRVMKERMVKTTTITLALSNKQNFHRRADGRYELKLVTELEGPAPESESLIGASDDQSHKGVNKN